jgi:hypothetical protein
MSNQLADEIMVLSRCKGGQLLDTSGFIPRAQ